MSEYIRRDAIKWHRTEHEERCHNEIITVRETVAYKEEVDCIPSEDVQEVKRGKWELVDETPYIRKHFHPVACSVCRAKGYKQWNYCPNCGAKMHD